MMDIESDEDVPLAKVIKRFNKDESATPPIDLVHEYKWPQDAVGNYKLIHESFVKFLGIDESATVLNELKWQQMTENEKEYISQLNILKQNKKNKDLHCIFTEDACQFMLDHFPKKFKEFVTAVHHREIKKIVNQQEAQRVSKGKLPHYMKRALHGTAEYNSRLNAERREERQAYFDLQTQIIHHPQKKRKHCFATNTNSSRYPLALLPGQYQDFYKRYTAEELKSLPLNTVLHQRNVSNDDSTKISETKKSDENKPKERKPTDQKDDYCGICMKGNESNKRGKPERLIHCTQCASGGHPSCLGMGNQMVSIIHGYKWQCMECKVCTECLAPHDEDEMMFCDNCDRGYHSYCVGLKDIPKGRWVCTICGVCCSCLSTTPLPNSSKGDWKKEFTHASDGIVSGFLQNHCHRCSKLFNDGNFCPVCLKVYCDDDDVINRMICCDVCERWVHTDCDAIDDERYTELSKDHGSAYTCILCRGEKEERMDLFHKKNKLVKVMNETS